MKGSSVFAWAGVIAMIAAGCQRDNMWIQAKVPRLGETAFFEDGRSAREPVAGTVTHGGYNPDPLVTQGLEQGRPTLRFPFAIEAKALARGNELYTVSCQPCHGTVGDGAAIVVLRGYRPPKPFADQTLLSKPVGELYRLCLNGVPRPAGRQPDILAGTGYDLEDVVHPVLWRKLSLKDRWSVLAWVKVLQTSQHFPASELSADEARKLDEAPASRSQDGNR